LSAGVSPVLLGSAGFQPALLKLRRPSSGVISSAAPALFAGLKNLLFGVAAGSPRQVLLFTVT